MNRVKPLVALDTDTGRLAQPGQSDWLRTSLSGVRIPQRPFCVSRTNVSDRKRTVEGFEAESERSERPWFESLSARFPTNDVSSENGT